MIVQMIVQVILQMMKRRFCSEVLMLNAKVQQSWCRAGAGASADMLKNQRGSAEVIVQVAGAHPV